jgi:hypothetical protein
LAFCVESVDINASALLGTPYELPEGGAMMEGILQHIVGSTLQRRASADEKIRLAARIVAESMRAVNIRVTSSSDIGGSFPVNGEFIFTHENCWRTSQESRPSFTIEEDVRDICGEHSIVLYYDYQRDPFAAYAPGQIRLVDAAGARCLKYYESDGTVTFRYDSFLSHLSIMRGFQCKAPAYSLPPGRVANW